MGRLVGQLPLFLLIDLKQTRLNEPEKAETKSILSWPRGVNVRADVRMLGRPAAECVLEALGDRTLMHNLWPNLMHSLFLDHK